LPTGGYSPGTGHYDDMDYYGGPDRAPLPLGLANREPPPDQLPNLVKTKPPYRQPPADWFVPRPEPLDFSVAPDIWSEYVDSRRHPLLRHADRDDADAKTRDSYSSSGSARTTRDLSKALVSDAPDVHGLDSSMYAYRLSTQPKLRTDVAKTGRLVGLGGLGALANEALAPTYASTSNLSALSDWPVRSMLVNPPRDLSPRARLDAQTRAQALRTAARDIIALSEARRLAASSSDGTTDSESQDRSHGGTRRGLRNSKASGASLAAALPPEVRKKYELARRLLRLQEEDEGRQPQQEGGKGDTAQSNADENEDNPDESDEEDDDDRANKPEPPAATRSFSSMGSASTAGSSTTAPSSTPMSASALAERSHLLAKNAAATTARLQRQLKQHLRGVDEVLESLGVSTKVDIRKELLGAFASVDRDRDGKISRRELEALFTMGITKLRTPCVQATHEHGLPSPAAGPARYVSPFSNAAGAVANASNDSLDQDSSSVPRDDDDGSSTAVVTGSETGLPQGFEWKALYAARLPTSVARTSATYGSTKAITQAPDQAHGKHSGRFSNGDSATYTGFYAATHRAIDIHQAQIKAQILEAETRDYNLLRQDQEEQGARRRAKQLAAQQQQLSAKAIAEEESKLLAAFEKGSAAQPADPVVDLETLSKLRREHAESVRSEESKMVHQEKEEEIERMRRELLGPDVQPGQAGANKGSEKAADATTSTSPTNRDAE